MQFSNDDLPQKAQVLASLMPAKPEGLLTKKFLVAEDSSPSLSLPLQRDYMRSHVEEEVAMTISNCVPVIWGFCKYLLTGLPSPP